MIRCSFCVFLIALLLYQKMNKSDQLKKIRPLFRKPSSYIVYVLRGFYRRRRRRHRHRTSHRGRRGCSNRRNGPCRGYRALEHDVLALLHALDLGSVSLQPCNKVIKAKVGYITYYMVLRMSLCITLFKEHAFSIKH